VFNTGLFRDGIFDFLKIDLTKLPREYAVLIARKQ
jgi:hypothetical protein